MTKLEQMKDEFWDWLRDRINEGCIIGRSRVMNRLDKIIEEAKKEER